MHKMCRASTYTSWYNFVFCFQHCWPIPCRTFWWWCQLCLSIAKYSYHLFSFSPDAQFQLGSCPTPTHDLTRCSITAGDSSTPASIFTRDLTHFTFIPKNDQESLNSPQAAFWEAFHQEDLNSCKMNDVCSGPLQLASVHRAVNLRFFYAN